MVTDTQMQSQQRQPTSYNLEKNLQTSVHAIVQWFFPFTYKSTRFQMESDRSQHRPGSICHLQDKFKQQTEPQIG